METKIKPVSELKEKDIYLETRLQEVVMQTKCCNFTSRETDLQ